MSAYVLSDLMRSLPGRRLLAALVAACAVSLSFAQGDVVVPTAKVQRLSVGSGFEMDGVVQPVKQSTVSAQASGRIATLVVKAGDRVRAGQLLATIDDRDAQTGVQRSQAQVAQATAELRNAQANFERTRELQGKGFISAAAMDTAQAQLKAAQAGRDQAVALERQSSLYQGFTRVSAPFDAWVLQTLAEAGELAVPGKPLLTLYAPLPLRAVVQVPVTRSAEVAALAQAGKAVEVQLPGADGAAQWVRPGAVLQVPNADPVSQTIEWRLALPDAVVKGVLPGQQVRVRFASGQSQRLMVPQAAVLRRGELTAVYVATAQGFALKVVRLGADHGAQGIEVLAGLGDAEQVALDPVRAGLSGAKAAAQ